MSKEKFRVGDIVHSVINSAVNTYEITKTFKTVCWVKAVDGVWIDKFHIYKGVKYNILKHGRRPK